LAPSLIAQGLRQALAATDLFFGDSLAALDTAALAAALAGNSVPSEAPLPSMIIDLARDQVVSQPLERLLIASTLVESKSEPALLKESDGKGRGG